MNLGFEAGGERAGHLQADHLCSLELGVWPQCRHHFHMFQFCLLCSVCSLLLEEDGGLTQETEVVDYR